MSEAAFDPLALLRALYDGGVEFVLIGGVAARIHGSPTLTRDVDICHSRDKANLERLAATLRKLRARLRGVEEDVSFRLDAETLETGANFTFATDAGDLDLLAAPAGVDGFAELTLSAATMAIDDMATLVASLEDLIRMKRAAGRPKDLIEVEVLLTLAAEVGQPSGADG